MVFHTILTVHEYLGHFLTVKGKKVGGNGSKKVCPKWVTPYLAYPHEKCSKWKSTVSSNDYGVPKNFHISKEKIIFWLSLWFWKNHKNGQKLIFSFERWKFFLHTLIICENWTFSFSTLFDLLKKWLKMKTKTLLCMGNFCHFWPKNAKNINFHEKFLFSDLFYE